MSGPSWQVVGSEPDPAKAAAQWQVVGQMPEPSRFGNALAGVGGDIAGVPGAGVGDVVGTALGNLPGEIKDAAVDAYRMIRGEPSEAAQPRPGLNAAGENLVHEIASIPTGHDAQGVPLTVGEDLHRLGQGFSDEASSLEQARPGLYNFLHGAARAGGDAATLLPVAGGVKSVVKGGVDAIGDALANAGESADTNADWYKAGLRTGAGHPIARQVAGDTANETVAGHNQQVGQAIVASEAGHAPTAPMSYESLAEARAPANSVYNRVANALPPNGQLDATARQGIESAGLPEGGRMTQGSPQAQQMIATLKQQLLDPERTFTGDQMVNETRGLRQEGYTNIGSEDVDKQQLGQAQLDMARAIEGHIGRNLPTNGDVSLEQFQNARQQLAKNWTAQGILRGGDVDLKALARVQRADPQMLTGGLKTLADFANGEGKNVVSIPNKFNPPSVFRDAKEMLRNPVGAGAAGAAIATGHVIPAVSAVGAGLIARPLARRILTGGTESAVQDALRAFPGRPPESFGPLEPRPPEAPPGLTAVTPPAAAPAGRLPLGDFATVLSQGVGESPPAGLSIGPMAGPGGEGLTYHGSPEVFGAQPVHGGAPALQPRFQDDYGNEVNPNAEVAAPPKLGDRIAGGSGPEPEGPPNLRRVQIGNRFAGEPTVSGGSDMAAVRAEGVPAGTTTRTAPQPAVQHEADEQMGEHIVTSKNGSTLAQESGPYLIVKRSDTAKAAQGNGEGLARMEALIQQAEHRGLRLGSDISVSPAQQRVYAALQRKGYRVIQNPAAVSPTTGNLVSNDVRKPVFEVRSALGQAVGQ